MSNIKKCDIFTPDKVGAQMASFLTKKGNFLEPSVGIGDLLKHIDYKTYKKVDICDVEQEYLDQIENNSQLNKITSDFLKHKFKYKYHDILMNPPYIKFQELEPEYRKFIKDTYDILNTGNIDIYLAFILKAINILHSKGVLVSINPNSFLYNKSCAKFREYLISNKLIVEIIDFKSEKVFDKADVYCCILIINKKKKTFLKYNGEKIYYKNIKSRFFENINDKCDTDKLEKHIEISNGLATIRDKIFFHKEKLFDEPCWRQVYKVSKNITNWAICPYDNEAKIIDEETLKTNNPKTYKFLLSKKDELAKRDKGKKTYVTWYAYGRTQGLKILKEDNTDFIYISTMCNKDLKIYEKKSILYYSGLAIKLKKKSTLTLEIVKNTIRNNIDEIYKNSSKRGNDWFNLSGTIIKKLYIKENEIIEEI